jgi:7-keto-8-aminopelargonate synthetase-like enzyme
VGDANNAVAFAEQLFAEGVYAPAIRPPTVPESTSRIRVTITSEHTLAHIEQALGAFERAGKTARLL